MTAADEARAQEIASHFVMKECDDDRTILIRLVAAALSEARDQGAREATEQCIHALPGSMKSDGYHSDRRDGWNDAISESVDALTALLDPDAPAIAPLREAVVEIPGAETVAPSKRVRVVVFDDWSCGAYPDHDPRFTDDWLSSYEPGCIVDAIFVLPPKEDALAATQEPTQ